MNPIPQAPLEYQTESLNTSSESTSTGKRVRKKNPKYDDDMESNNVNVEEQEQEYNPKNVSRPRKKRKLSTATPIPAPTNHVQYLNSLKTLKQQLQEKLNVIQSHMSSVDAEIQKKQEELCLTPENVEQLLSELDPEIQYDVPTDDEDDMIDIEIPDVEPILELPASAPTPTPITTQPTNGRGGNRRGKATSTRKGKKKATTKRAAPKRKAPAPKRTTKPSDPELPPPFKFCRQVLDQLMKHRYAFPFNQPVDHVALGIPTYPLIIKNPMDFGTIRQKLNDSEYDNVEQFKADVNLVFNNAFTFNTPESDVYLMASSLQNHFKERIKSVEKKMAPEKPPAAVPKVQPVIEQADSGAFRDLKKSVDTICNEIRVLLGQQNASPNGSRKRVVKREEIPLTKEEKRRLSAGINSLSSSQLAEVVKIIKEKLPNIGTEKEIVIDIDSLDTGTLRSLESYVQSTKLKKPKRKSTRSKTGTALQADPEARLKLAKLTEQGMQSKIESVKRQLEQLRSNNNLQSSLNRSTTDIQSINVNEGNSNNESVKEQKTIEEPEAVPSTGDIATPLSIKNEESSGSESESESDESGSESEESESSSDNDVPGSYSAGMKISVETVTAPNLSNRNLPGDASTISTPNGSATI